MEEHETDILVVDPEEETEVLTENVNQTEKSYNVFFEIENRKKLDTKEHKPVKKEPDTFVNYNYNRLNKVYKKYDVMQTYVPKKEEKQKKDKEFEKFVEEQSSYVPEKETITIERVAEKPTFKLKSKAKAWLISIIIIVTMFGWLCIYNAFNINSLQNQIDQTTTSINNVNKDIETIIKDIGKLTNEDEIKNNAGDLGLNQVEPSKNIQIELNDKNIIEDYQSETNFFDKICDFIRNLFGG